MYRIDQDRLYLSNATTEAVIRIRPFFAIETLKFFGKNAVIQTGHLLLADRTQFELADRATLLDIAEGKTNDAYETDGIKLLLRYQIDDITLTRHLYLYDDAPALRYFDIYESQNSHSGMYYSDLGSFQLEFAVKSAKAVDFFCCTDQSNHRLRETPAGDKNRGGFMIFEDVDGGGVYFYKEGPMPDGQPIKSEYDFCLDKASNVVNVLGLGFDNLRPGEVRRANGCVIGALEEASSLLGLHRYQACRYRCDSTYDFETLTNSWPSFGHDPTEERILKELEVAAKSGIRDVFIDDGWFESFMGEIDLKKFPNGFTAVAAKAKELGLKLGLWMNPLGLDAKHPKAELWDGAERFDAFIEGNNWNWLARSADFRQVEYNPTGDGKGYSAMDLCHPGYFEHIKHKIIDMYQTYGIDRYKFDLYQLDVFNTLRGDGNIHFEKYRELLTELKAAIPDLVISMDVTRGNRPCFDFALDFGRLFLENRGRGIPDYRYYHPYMALGNLHDTMKYCPSNKIELEFMAQIDDYNLEYIFGTTLFANPLYWGALAEMSPERAEQLGALIRLLTPVRECIAGNLNFPAPGPQPGKDNWSALVSLDPAYPKRTAGYLAVYRHGSASVDYEIELPLFKGRKLNLKTLLGNHADVNDGKLYFVAEHKFTFQLFEIVEL